MVMVLLVVVLLLEAVAALVVLLLETVASLEVMRSAARGCGDSVTGCVRAGGAGGAWRETQ